MSVGSEWTEMTWCAHAVEHCSAREEGSNAICSNTAETTLNKGSQKEKDKHHVLSLKCRTERPPGEEGNGSPLQ